MFWIFGYCVLCWLIGVGFVTWSNRHCDDEGRAAELAAAHPACHAIISTLIVAITPIVLPFALVWIGYQLMLVQWPMLRAGRRYRELRFERVNFFHLDERIRSGFETANGEFLQLGFDLLGDFQNKFEPLPVYNRCFAGPGGTVFGDLTALLETCSAGFVSVLEDGTYVETSGTEPFEMKGELQDDDLTCLVLAGKRPVAELLDLHLEAVVREAERRATRVLAFEREQFKQVFIFGQRRFFSWRKRCGERTGPIPDAVVPEGEPIDPSNLRAPENSSCTVAAVEC